MTSVFDQSRQSARMLRVLVAVVACVVAIASAPARAQGFDVKWPAFKAAPLDVVVTVPALKGLIEPLTPEGSTVTMLMKPGRSEHSYEFSAPDIAALTKADVVFLVGLELELRVEDALARKQNVARRVVNFGEALGLKQSEGHEHHDHAPGEVCNHGGDWVDQHLWLDPVLVEQILPKLRDAVRESLLVKAAWNDEVEKQLNARYDMMLKIVQEVHSEWAKKLEPFKGMAIVTHHDAFSRPASRYGLTVAAVIRPGQASETTARDIANAVKAIREQKASAVFIEPQFDGSVAERIAKRANVRIGQLDPVGDGDWFRMMRRNLHELSSKLRAEKDVAPLPADPDVKKSDK